MKLMLYITFQKYSKKNGYMAAKAEPLTVENKDLKQINHLIQEARGKIKETKKYI